MPPINGVRMLTLFLLATALRSAGCQEEWRDEDFLKSTRHFAVELLKAASEKGGNTVLSPVSVSTILALIQQGAGGNTATEFARVLALDADLSKIGYRGLAEALTAKSQHVTLEWANKIYSKSGLTFNSTFVQDAEQNFRTMFEEMNFEEESSEVIADAINRWISESTHGQIKDVVLPHMVSADLIMLLVNAMYFKGNWRSRFREKNTKTENFDKSPSESVPASFMHQKGRFYTGRNLTLGVKWVEMPFQGDTHKMIFVLPLKRHALDKVMSRLTGDDVQNMMSYGDATQVRLRVPKFKLQGKYSLVALLQSLGLREVFTAASDLSGMSPEPLRLSDALHQANVEIDERGSTASAATVVFMSRKLTLPEMFRLDQPFLFFIIDNANGIPLFAGKVVDPTSS